MNVPQETGIIGLRDLPKTKVLVGLKKLFKEDLLNCINIKKAKRDLRLTNSKFDNFKYNEKITLDFLFKIIEYLFNKGFKQFSIENVEKNIEIMGTKRGNIYLRDPKLPFNFNNEEGAYFISAIFFDGGIDRQFKPHYGNLDFGMRLRIIKSVKKLFGEIHSRETNPSNRNFIRFPKIIGIIINHCFGIGIGNKMYCNNKIPNFIFNIDKSKKACFIRQAFDDDGSVSVDKKMIRLVGVTDVKKDDFNKNNTDDFNLLNGIKRLLLDFGIDPNPFRIERSFSNINYRKQGEFYRHIFTFSITGKKNLETFYGNIGFNLNYKMKRLKSLIKSYKSNQLRKGEIKKIALEKIKYLELRYGYFTNLLLAKEIERSYRQTAKLTEKLLKENKIRIVQKAIPIGIGWKPIKFRIV